jgi:hypothetical protein
MSNIEHFPRSGRVALSIVKAKDLTPKANIICALHHLWRSDRRSLRTAYGSPRTEPHRDRKLSAAEAVEKEIGNDNNPRSAGMSETLR